MIFQKAAQLSKLAKSKGYDTRVQNGKVQYVLVTYHSNGKSIVSEKSAFVPFDIAIDLLNSLPALKHN